MGIITTGLQKHFGTDFILFETFRRLSPISLALWMPHARTARWGASGFTESVASSHALAVGGLTASQLTDARSFLI